MFKKILISLALLAATSVQAQQPPFVRNDSNTSVLNGVNGRQGSAAVDAKGVLSTNPVSSGGLSAVAIEDTVAGSGFAGIPPLGVANESAAAVGANGDFTPISTNTFGAVYVDVNANFRSQAAQNLLKIEDTAAASGDALVGVAGRINTSGATLAADGDYTTPALDTLGGAMLAGGTYGPVVFEDVAFTQGEYVTKMGFQTQDPLTVDQTSTNDVAIPKVDRAGRTITTLAPAGESWQACTGAITDTTQTAIKAAVASNRIYVTSIGCNNSSAVASTLVFQDASTAIWQGAITAASVGGAYTMTFPVPLRGTVNTALNVTLGTTATNTRCCASGYISVN